MGSVESPKEELYDVLILGAGLSGLCSLYHIRKRCPTWRIKILEAGEAIGGTWFWNCYPGARFDSESISYAFSFDKEILDEWHWKEAFSPQSETLKYLNFVCDKKDLRKDIQLNTRIASAAWQDHEHRWLLTDAAGIDYKTTFLVTCLGFLSAPTLPAIPGVEKFQGKSFHTSRWPKDVVLDRDFNDKRVGVIGTGATGIQVITQLAKQPVKSLRVFQRTANWAAPLRNSEITPEMMAQHRIGSDAVFKHCLSTWSGFMHGPDSRKTLEVTDEERLALYEDLYSKPGFGKWLGVFSDTYTSREANRLYSEFHAQKIRTRVNNPGVAESLVPKDHGFGTRRIPLESGYYEVYNQPNVHLIDLKKTPVAEVSAAGILTNDGLMHELDILVYATGFDAVTGAFSAINWQGKHGRPLIGHSDDTKQRDAIWLDYRIKTLLGITIPSMPNMLTVLGPHQPYGNATRNVEHAVQVVTDLLGHCRDNGYTYLEPSEAAAEPWTEHVVDVGTNGSLLNEVDSWMTGVNKNVKGKTTRSVARYVGNVVEYRRRCRECQEAGWEGITFA